MSVHPPPRAETRSEGPVPLAPGHKPYVPDGEEMPELTWSAVAPRARSWASSSAPRRSTWC